jgi:cbb3-type cytochrome oxidase subunit 3
MTLGGWFTMIFSLVLVWGGTFWCFWKVMQSPQDEQAPSGYGP